MSMKVDWGKKTEASKRINDGKGVPLEGLERQTAGACIFFLSPFSFPRSLLISANTTLRLSLPAGTHARHFH